MFGDSFRKKKDEADEELNLTPIMNLFVVMIPFLLFSATFYQVSIINASVPTIAEGALEAGQSEKVMNVILQMGSNGYELMGNGEQVTLQELESVRKAIPKRQNTFDVQALNGVLAQVKWRFPKGKTLILVPEKNISYEHIVATMDAARWSRTKTENGITTDRSILYSNVVLSSVVEGS